LGEPYLTNEREGYRAFRLSLSSDKVAYLNPTSLNSIYSSFPAWCRCRKITQQTARPTSLIALALARATHYSYPSILLLQKLADTSSLSIPVPHPFIKCKP
jgi:hypothetical protein